ncbi:methyltransferase domain-containing protein [Candidatus Kaiserbacteria bacterium]|nr:methyltransferase domain-containing protein [Candidatus Kaiserbacteria bacterium]
MPRSPIDWDAYARYYDTLTTLIPYQEMLDTVCHHLHECQTPILDAGCGTGNVTHLLTQVTDEITAIDQAQEMLSRARAKCAGETVSFKQVDLDEVLPFQGDTFGAIVCVNVLYAVKNPAETLAEFYRILRPEGTLVLVTPKAGYENGLILKAHADSPKPDEHWLNMHCSPQWERARAKEALGEKSEAFLELIRFNRRIAESATFHFFTPRTLIRCVKEAGFQSVYTEAVYADQNILLSARKESS